MKTIKILIFVLSIPVSLFCQDFKTVHDGVEYAEVTREISGLKVNMNLLRLDLTKVRLDVVHAMDKAIGVEKTSSIAARHGALAAINAGFFRLDTTRYAGDPAGAFMIDKKLLSETDRNRIALSIRNGPQRTDVGISHLELVSFFTLEGGGIYRFTGINRERKDAVESILYTPEFHSSTLTDNDGLEIVVSDGKIAEIRDGVGDAAIPARGYVISLRGMMRELIRPILKKGRKVQWYTTTGPAGPPALQKKETGEFNKTEDIVAGVPQLIKNGKIDITWEQEKTTKSFVETRHPRTAAAKLKDGKFLMITVDGRSESSGGIGLADLAEYLLSLGAVDAMNLDGGGSTTMFLDGKLVNHPSDKEGERKVSDALIVRKR